jgi:hypothetical protein
LFLILFFSIKWTKKRFRIKPASVYLFCLSINDTLFLLIHSFEDTLRTFNDVYFQSTRNESSFSLFINSINIIDNYNYACIIGNYLRYTLRFISAYIYVAFTIQRLAIVYSPFTNKSKTTHSAWITIHFIVGISFLFNIWVPFLFEITTDSNELTYCDIKMSRKTIYFVISSLYICLITLIPITVMFYSLNLY